MIKNKIMFTTVKINNIRYKYYLISPRNKTIVFAIFYKSILSIANVVLLKNISI